MKTFGQVITAARKRAGLTQKEVAELIRREDGRKVLPPYLNDLEHDRRYPPENVVIEQLAKILRISADVLTSTPSACRRMLSATLMTARWKRPIAPSGKFCRRPTPPTRSVRSEPVRPDSRRFPLYSCSYFRRLSCATAIVAAPSIS